MNLTRRSAGLDQLIRIEPELPDTYVVRAAGWKHKKQYDKAIADLTEAIRLDPRNTGAYHDRASLWAELKQFDKAIADYSAGDPARAYGGASCYCSRAFAYKAAKNFEKAIADYTEAIRLDPKDSDAYCGRGWAWHEMNAVFATRSRISTMPCASTPRRLCHRRPCVDRRHLPRPIATRRQESRRAGHRGLRADALEGGVLPRDPGRGLRRNRRFRLGREMANQGDRAGSRREGESANTAGSSTRTRSPSSRNETVSGRQLSTNWARFVGTNPEPALEARLSGLAKASSGPACRKRACELHG